MKRRYILGTGSKRVYNSGLHPDLKTIIDLALFTAPIDFTLTSGVRSASDQWRLFTIGRRYKGTGSKTDWKNWEETGGGVVTYADGCEWKSNHQKKDDGYGHAFDFQCYIQGRPDLAYDKIHMSVLIGAFLSMADSLRMFAEIKHTLRSGADWDKDTQYLEQGTFIDMPHLEIVKP